MDGPPAPDIINIDLRFKSFPIGFTDGYQIKAKFPHLDFGLEDVELTFRRGIRPEYASSQAPIVPC